MMYVFYFCNLTNKYINLDTLLTAYSLPYSCNIFIFLMINLYH